MAIEQAKGVLAERRGISVDAAFALLRSYARSHNLRLSGLARDVAQCSAAAAAFLEIPRPRPEPAHHARTS
jgi:AmiR/NasT family two-component response regulator